MKHLKLFLNDIDYQDYAKSDDYIKPNVSYAKDTHTVYYNLHHKNIDFIIMTYESNPAVMDVCYYQGWAASPDVMYKSEAEKVTDIGTAFQGLKGTVGGNTDPYSTYESYEYGTGSDDLTYEYGTYGGDNLIEGFTSFDEFKYFTGVTTIDDDAFNDCSNLTSITIPDSVTSIGNNAFDGCYSLPVIDNIRYADTYLIEATDETLTTYNIKEGTKFIGSGAFNDCSSLTSITIPDSVTSIAYNAFDGCYSLPVIDNIRYADTYLIEATDETLTTYNIKEGTKFIGNYAFSYYSKLTSITIPDSVTSIGSGAFYYCSGLTGATIGSGVTSIGNSAFYYCAGLTGELVIPDGVTSIGNEAFSGCSGLTGELVIPDSVTSIGSSAFAGCRGLTSVVIGSGVTSISVSAFFDCSGLTSVVIPDSVTRIGQAAFRDCNGLTEITCNAITAPTIGSSTFMYIKTGGILYVPAGSDYSSWMSTGDYYLGKYGWTTQEF